MSISLNLTFDSFEDLEIFIVDMNKFKKWKSKQEKKKEKTDDTVEEKFEFTNDRRGLHQQEYHNRAKLYQAEHPELSYREALKFVYKNNKNVEI